MNPQNISQWLIVFMVVLTGCNKPKVADVVKSDAIILDVQGKSYVVRNEIIPVIKGMELQSNDVLRVENGKVKILLSDDRGVITIKDKSEVSLASLGSSNTDININQGKMQLVLAKIIGDRKFEFKTPTAVAGVRGTTFMVDVQTNKRHAFPYSVQLEDGSKDVSKIAVFTGSVAIIDDGKEKLINQLQQTTIAEGIKFEDIKIEKIELASIKEFVDIREIEQIKSIKMQEEIKKIKQVEAGEVDGILAETIIAPKNKC